VLRTRRRRERRFFSEKELPAEPVIITCRGIRLPTKPEAFSRVLIDQALKDSGWDLLDDRRVRFELCSLVAQPFLAVLFQSN
jgi:hypothetical protein